MKLKGLSHRERSEELRKWKDNRSVACAKCGKTVRAKDAAHARTAPDLPNYVCHICLNKEDLLYKGCRLSNH